MIDPARLEKLQALITKTKALDDVTRQKLLKKVPSLNEEQIGKLEKTITTADEKLKKIDQETQKKIAEENTRYHKTLTEFQLKTIPQALKIAEKEHRIAEEAKAEELLQEAANL